MRKAVRAGSTGMQIGEEFNIFELLLPAGGEVEPIWGFDLLDCLGVFTSEFLRICFDLCGVFGS